ncbi:hypothetical protein D4N17_27065 [Klebsiella pneumoniae]|nr:hypothetical protein C3E93_22235 [Klebsiella pneumoniae]TXT96138.1 hypothetical protein D4N17_27065 [Klebsiella pneumoniae]
MHMHENRPTKRAEEAGKAPRATSTSLYFWQNQDARYLRSFNLMLKINAILTRLNLPIQLSRDNLLIIMEINKN